MKTTTKTWMCPSAHKNAVTVINKLLAGDFAIAEMLVPDVLKPNNVPLHTTQALMEVALSNPEIVALRVSSLESGYSLDVYYLVLEALEGYRYEDITVDFRALWAQACDDAVDAAKAEKQPEFYAQAHTYAVALINQILTQSVDIPDDLVAEMQDRMKWRAGRTAIDVAQAAMEIALSNPEISNEVSADDVISLVYDYIDHDNIYPFKKLRARIINHAWLYNPKLDIAWSDLTVAQCLMFVNWWKTDNDGSLMITADRSGSYLERKIEDAVPFTLHTVAFGGSLRLVLVGEGAVIDNGEDELNAREMMDSGFMCPENVRIRNFNMVCDD